MVFCFDTEYIPHYIAWLEKDENVRRILVNTILCPPKFHCRKHSAEIVLACWENLVNFFCPLLTRVLKCAVKKWSLIQKGPVAHDDAQATAAGEEATAATPNGSVLPPRGRSLSRKPRGVGRGGGRGTNSGGGRGAAPRIGGGGVAVQEATGAATKQAEERELPNVLIPTVVQASPTSARRNRKRAASATCRGRGSSEGGIRAQARRAQSVDVPAERDDDDANVAEVTADEVPEGMAAAVEFENVTDESAEGLADAMLNGFEELRAQEGLESDEGESDGDEDQDQDEGDDIMDEEQLDEAEVARVLSEMTSKGAVNLLSREKYGSTRAGRQKQRPMKELRLICRAKGIPMERDGCALKRGKIVKAIAAVLKLKKNVGENVPDKSAKMNLHRLNQMLW